MWRSSPPPRAPAVQADVAALEAREQSIVAAIRGGTTTVDLYGLKELP